MRVAGTDRDHAGYAANHRYLRTQLRAFGQICSSTPVYGERVLVTMGEQRPRRANHVRVCPITTGNPGTAFCAVPEHHHTSRDDAIEW